jgi:hypothetical protein
MNRQAHPIVCRFIGLSVYRFIGLSVYRFIGLSVYRSAGRPVPPNMAKVSVAIHWHSEHSSQWNPS